MNMTDGKGEMRDLEAIAFPDQIEAARAQGERARAVHGESIGAHDRSPIFSIAERSP